MELVNPLGCLVGGFKKVEQAVRVTRAGCGIGEEREINTGKHSYGKTLRVLISAITHIGHVGHTNRTRTVPIVHDGNDSISFADFSDLLGGLIAKHIHFLSVRILYEICALQPARPRPRF
jgi:hypothetical protein